MNSNKKFQIFKAYNLILPNQLTHWCHANIGAAIRAIIWSPFSLIIDVHLNTITHRWFIHAKVDIVDHRVVCPLVKTIWNVHKFEIVEMQCKFSYHDNVNVHVLQRRKLLTTQSLYLFFSGIRPEARLIYIRMLHNPCLFSKVINHIRSRLCKTDNWFNDTALDNNLNLRVFFLAPLDAFLPVLPMSISIPIHTVDMLLDKALILIGVHASKMASFIDTYPYQSPFQSTQSMSQRRYRHAPWQSPSTHWCAR